MSTATATETLPADVIAAFDNASIELVVPECRIEDGLEDAFMEKLASKPELRTLDMSKVHLQFAHHIANVIAGGKAYAGEEGSGKWYSTPAGNHNKGCYWEFPGLHNLTTVYLPKAIQHGADCIGTAPEEIINSLKHSTTILFVDPKIVQYVAKHKGEAGAHMSQEAMLVGRCEGNRKKANELLDKMENQFLFDRHGLPELLERAPAVMVIAKERGYSEEKFNEMIRAVEETVATLPHPDLPKSPAVKNLNEVYKDGYLKHSTPETSRGVSLGGNH